MHSTPTAVPARRSRRDRAVHIAAEDVADGLGTPSAAAS